MTRIDLLAFMREHQMAVQASVSSSGGPQAAVVGIVVTDELEIFFDTLATSRKAKNLRGNPRFALVIGGAAKGEERTVQYEGVADEPLGAELVRLKNLYFHHFPDGRDREALPDITYVRVTPTWIRYSDFSRDPWDIVEFAFEPRRS
jgi:general stress protein 26